MTAPDPFALGGRQGDSELIEAEREWLALLAQQADTDIDEELDALGAKIRPLEDFIDNTAPQGWAGLAVKLRRLAHPDVGIGMAPYEGDSASLQQCVEFVEREAGRAAP